MSAFSVVGEVDLGLFSDAAASIDFYERTVGLRFVQTLRHSPTYEERFYSLHGSSLKINYSTDGMPEGRSGYRALALALPDHAETVELVDPHGLPVRLCPELPSGCRVEITCAVPDPARYTAFLAEGLGAAAEGDAILLGGTAFRATQRHDAVPTSPPWSRGFNYIVVMVSDVLAAHAELIGLGGEHSVPPTLLPGRCAFSWLRDPSGGWLELVQPASGSRPLPEVVPIERRWQELIAWRTSGIAFG